MQSFKARPVLVTGAGRGIGKRLAIGFAATGARVGLLARSKAELDLCHLEIEHAGGSALRLRADVCDFEQVTAAVERMRVQFGAHPTVLLCAAAILGPIGPFVETGPKIWDEVIRTNFTGVLNACRAVLPHMIAERSGKIIILSGGGATPSRPNFALYNATKTALVRFAETLAEEVEQHNIQVNCLSPGATYTHMTDQILTAGERAGWREVEEARHVRITGGVPPEKQIELALFLASEQSNHISGRLISVQDDWKKLRDRTVSPELYRLRRAQKG
ncbi:MAG: SDR family oxidoreductase [Bryobacterales bacterium]|nr:SDR family oxidoreductase [Bryobacterales bacterium]MBV9400394.1 SDR family oxidoreductase [Bryobacterales bacterium]